MAKQASALSRLQIASPCPASWDAMQGDERSRFCNDCKLHVYNISAMSKSEAEALILQKEGKLCVRIYRRQDGTIITQDCPRALRWLQNRFRFALFVIASLLAWLLSYCKGEAQELQLKQSNYDLYDLPPAVAVNGGGSFIMNPKIELQDDKRNIPKKPTQYFCDIVPGMPPQLVLSLERPAKSISTPNTLPIPKLALQNLQRSISGSPLTTTTTLVNKAQSQSTVNGDNGSCTEDSSDIFVLLQKKRQRR